MRFEEDIERCFGVIAAQKIKKSFGRLEETLARVGFELFNGADVGEVVLVEQEAVDVEEGDELLDVDSRQGPALDVAEESSELIV